jgi:hypothetical protein
MFLAIAAVAAVTYLGAKKMVGYLNSNFDKKVEKQVDDKVSRIADTIPNP